MPNSNLTNFFDLNNPKDIESFYNIYFVDAPDMMISIDTQNKKIVEVNKALCSKLGYTRDELLNLDLAKLYAEECFPRVYDLFSAFMEKKDIINEELILQAKDGEKVYVLLNSRAILNEAGEVVRSNSTYRDITKIHKGEEELRKENANLELEIQERTKFIKSQNERMELAFKGTNDGIWDWMNVNEDKQWWSARLFELLGYAEGEFQPGIKIFAEEFLHPDDHEMTFKAIDACFFDKVPFYIEYRLKTKKEGYKWFRGRGDATRDEKGNPIRLTGSTADINEEKLLELKFAETQKFLTKVMDIAPIIIYVFDHKTMSNEYSNREIGEALGYSNVEIKEMGDQLFPNLCHPDDLGLVFGQMGKIKKLKNEESISIEYRMKHKDGRMLWLLSEDTVFERDENGEVSKHIGIATNITTIKDAQDLLVNQKEKLEVHNEDLKQLAYVATHDLKSPMVSIAGHFKYIKKAIENPDEDTLESIDFIETGINQFNKTLTGLSDAIRIKEGEIESNEINLSEIVKEEVEKFQQQIKSLDGTLHIDLEANLQMIGSSLYVKSILQNLFSNAVKYRSPNRKMEVSLSSNEDDEGYTFELEDNGLGIDLELNKGKVFKMFQQFHELPDGYSTGMGLYMVKSMVDKLGGTIEIESKVDKGTKFKLKFRKKK